jgi:uncharacterized protein YcfJ
MSIQNIQSAAFSLTSIDAGQLATVTGGQSSIPGPETIGCAVGGAVGGVLGTVFGAGVGGFFGGAEGCLLGGTAANYVAQHKQGAFKPRVLIK